MTTKDTDEPIWMPHAGHLCVSSWCQFHLNTYVNGFLISTVGEYVPDETSRRIIRESRNRQTTLRGDAERQDFGYEEIGYNRLYETMVFRAKRSTCEWKWQCCPWVQESGSEIDMQGYNTAVEAYQGHLYLVEKYRKMKEQDKPARRIELEEA